MNVTIRKRNWLDLDELLEAKRLELSRVVMSPQARAYPCHNAKKVLRLAAELLELSSAMEAREESYAQVSVAWEVKKTA